MAEKIRYTRKDLKGPDEFISTLGKGTAWARENRGKMVAAVVVVVLALAGVLGTRAYLLWQDQKAAKDLWPHLNRARELVQNPREVDPEKLIRLEQFLNGYVNMHPGAKTTVFARYYLGSIAYLRGEYEVSAAQFRSAIGLYQKQDTVMKFLAREGLAQALEAKGDIHGALAAYRDAASHAKGELRTQPWMGEARMLAGMGKKAEAAEVLRRILQENPDSPMREYIEVRLSQAG